VFRRCYAEHLFVDSRLYPGVAETLAALSGAGIRVGCITNKAEAFATALLNQAGIGGALDFIHGGDTFGIRKPHPEALLRTAAKYGIPPAEAVMVGDSINDFEAARRAGFDFIFARYGYVNSDRATLETARGTIGEFAELRGLLCAP